MAPLESQQAACWIIGYGNPQRRDDGIGPYVVAHLKEILKGRKEIAVRSLHQLAPELVEDVQDAKVLILVDATVEELAGGRHWSRITPDIRATHYLSHHCKPSHFLGLLQMLYRRCPTTWLISVQGDDFGFGAGLTPEAETRAQKVVSEVARHCSRRN